MDQRTKIIWNPFTTGYFQNPYDHLRTCRLENPIHKVSANSWIFLRYDDISRILSSSQFTVSELSEFFKEKESYIFKNSSACPFLSEGTKMWPMYLNHEPHKQVRTILGKSLNLRELENALVEFVTITNREHKEKPGFDLVTYCAQYIFRVVKQILGINNSGDFEQIRQYSSWLARSQDVYIPRQLYLEINSWLLWGKEIFTESEFRENIIQHSTQAGLDYTDDEVYSITALTLMAAFETSKDNLSIALYTILQDQQLINYVLECDPQQLNVLIEELFRFTSPLQYTVRVNRDALQYGDIEIPAQSKLYLSIASANRDEAIFQNPDQLLVDRNPNEHLSFGKGVHFCLGANIARLEMRACLKPMVSFLKDYQIKTRADVKWSKQIFMRTVESVELEARFQ